MADYIDLKNRRLIILLIVFTLVITVCIVFISQTASKTQEECTQDYVTDNGDDSCAAYQKQSSENYLDGQEALAH
jgi:hypothetical protein